MNAGVLGAESFWGGSASSTMNCLLSVTKRPYAATANISIIRDRIAVSGAD
jgi:hypothetical protein